MRNNFALRTRPFELDPKPIGRIPRRPSFPGRLNFLKDDWQALVRASSGYLELGMLKEAARALQKIAPEDRMRSAVLGVQVGLYIKQGNWNSAEALAGRLVKLEPEDAAWWIAYAYSTRYARTIEEAEAILQQARELHPRNAHILFNLASYASSTGRMEEAKVRLRHAMDLEAEIRQLALEEEDLRPLWGWIGSSE